LLAYGILQMDGVSGLAGWRWVYIIEVSHHLLLHCIPANIS
jgi:hypothetical protein